ncbi:MAG: SoxR reducing system RseC family protein [Xanthomonadales bacterium]|jgi:positive regulator of sigma E activity|nr:SoxR reducing system RseC family protein [Xanthomonadales bacterium]
MQDLAEHFSSPRIRPAWVVGVDDRYWHLQLAPSCHGCGGCAGNCEVIGSIDRHMRLTRATQDPILHVGVEVELVLSEASLLQQAWYGYGWPLLGMLIGAVLLNPFGSVAAALGALAGTLAAARISKRRAMRHTFLRPQIRRVRSAV